MKKLWREARKVLRRFEKNRRKTRRIMMGVIEDFCLWNLNKNQIIKDLIYRRKLIRNRLNGYIPSTRRT